MLKCFKSIALIGLCFGVVHAVHLRGVVKDQITGKPVANVDIYSNSNGKEITAKSGDNGTYNVSNVSAGTYKFYLSTSGYYSLNKEVTIDNKDTVVLDFELSPFDGIFKVLVKDSASKPLAGAEVYISYTKKGVTGADGKFEAANLKAGRQNIRIKLYGYKDTSFYDTISNANPEMEVVLVKAVFTSVKGVVSDTSGNPIGNVRIAVGDLITYTGSDGKFRFDTIPSWKLNWYLSHKSFRDTSFSMTLGASPSELEIKLVPLIISSISGIVRDSETQKPIEGVIVHITGFSSTGLFYDTTDINGAYSFDSIEAKELGWNIFLEKDGYEQIIDNFKITANKPEKLDFDMVAIKETGISGQKSKSSSSAAAFRYSSGVLNLVNISEPGEMRVFNLNGKLLFGQKFDRNCSVIPLPRSVISNRTTLIVNINAGTNNLKQAIMPFK